MTNKNIVDFIGTYGIFMVLMIMFAWLVVPKLYTAVFPTTSTALYDMSGISTGDTVNYNGKQYTVSTFYDMDQIGKMDVELTENNNNN